MKQLPPLAQCLSIRVCFLLTLAVPSLNAQQHEWIESTGGSFGDPGHWSPAVPSAGDLAWFNLLSDGYTVQLDQNRTMGTLQVANDTVVLDLNGFSLELTDPIQGEWSNSSAYTGTTSLMIGRGTASASESGSLTIRGGGTFTTEGISTGGTRVDGTPSVGTLIVEGAGTVFNSNGAVINTTNFGVFGESEFIVRQGAVANFQHLTLARRGSNSVGNAIIEDAGTQLNFNYLSVGHRGISDMVVRNGAQLNGIDAGTDNGRVDIVHNSSILTIDNATAHVGRTRIATHTAASSGAIHVINGAQLSVASMLEIGAVADSSGTVKVEGQGSVLSTSSQIRIGGTHTTDLGATAHLSIRDQGAVFAESIVYLWSKSSLQIEGGASLSASGLIGAAGGTLQVVLRSGEFAPLVTTTDASGVARVDGLILDLSTADDFSAVLGDTFTLLDYRGSLEGTFAGLEDGASITIGGYEFELSYGSGSSDAISLHLTAIPEPGSIAAIFAGVVFVLVIARLRKSASA